MNHFDRLFGMLLCHFPQISGPVPEISGYSANIWRASRMLWDFIILEPSNERKC